MPLTEHQRAVAKLLSAQRTLDSHLAGGAALHIAPNSKRYSNDLDYFHDSVERVANAFAADRAELVRNGYTVEASLNQPGFIRAVVGKNGEHTKVEWVHDSSWRFLPPVHHPDFGYLLHPIDLAINKVLALAGREEPRDYLDVLYVDATVLSLGALCWAAVGKDPGFTPISLLELLRRKGKYRPEDFARLHLTEPVDLPQCKAQWLAALEAAEALARRLPPSEIGCLYYATRKKRFVTPDGSEDVVPHYGRPGGVLPRIETDSALAEFSRDM